MKDSLTTSANTIYKNCGFDKNILMRNYFNFIPFLIIIFVQRVFLSECLFII